MRRVKKIIYILLSVVLISFSSCGGGQDDIYKELVGVDESSRELSEEVESSSLKVEGKEPAGTLNIFTYTEYYEYSDTKVFVDLFNKQYPKVNIEIIGPESSLGYSEALSLALASNKSVDVVDVSLLDIYKNYTEGVIIDLYDFYNNDSEIGPEDYYQNIIKAFEVKGALPFLAPLIGYDTVRLNKEITDELGIDLSSYDHITLSEIADIYNSAVEAEVSDSIYINNWEYFIIKGMQDILPTNSNDLVIDREVFEKYLNAYKSFYNMNVPEKSSDFFDPHKDDLTFTKNEMVRLFSPSVTRNNVVNYNEEGENYSKVLPISKNGESISFHTYRALSIPVASKNKELAWEFLKFVISDIDYGEQVKLGQVPYGIPINRNNLRKLFVTSLGANEDEVYELINNTMEKLDFACYKNFSLYDPIYYTLEDYGVGQISEDEIYNEWMFAVDSYFSE